MFLYLRSSPRPIAALVAGVNEAPGRIMGHAGAFTIPGEPDAMDKIRALADAGVIIVNHPSKFGDVLTKHLPGTTSASSASCKASPFDQQRRQMHTAPRRPRRDIPARKTVLKQRRTLYLSQDKSFDVLTHHGIPVSRDAGEGPHPYLAIGIDRSARSPCVMAWPATEPGQMRRFPFDYRRGAADLDTNDIASHLGLVPRATGSLQDLIAKLAALFYEKEAFLLSTSIAVQDDRGTVAVAGARLGFDDAAFHSAGRQADVQALRGAAAEDPAEAAAAQHGIVYIKLPDGGAIGTLVNGAGLAMNTVDALADAAGRAANFLDTGGKATSETVRRALEAVLSDGRVRVVLVNIFGGLTRGDMIARGVLLAFAEVDVRVPVVVRIRGTNEAEGQRIIAESGLPLFAYDDFDEAAAKAVELSRASSQ